MAMLAPVHVENFGRFFGRNELICAHSTGENRADPLLLLAFSAFQEDLFTCFSGMFDPSYVAKQEPHANFVRRSVFLSGKALPSFIELAGMHAANVRI